MRLGCTSLYRVTRILVIVNWNTNEFLGRPLCRFRVKYSRLGFYIPELIDLINRDECFKRDDEYNCVKYVCNKVSIPKNIEEVLDSIIRVVSKISEEELNKRVINNPKYEELLSRGGFL